VGRHRATRSTGSPLTATTIALTSLRGERICRRPLVALCDADQLSRGAALVSASGL
jgi:hypothetical protein